jgi:predicted amidohydrolase YtcJ
MSGLLIRGVRRIGTSGTPCDVLVLEGRVASVTPASVTTGPALAHSSPADVEIVDASGAWIGPGLWDHHSHFDQWALFRRRVGVEDCDSADAVAARIADAVRTGVADDVVVAHGYRDGLWRAPADRGVLDRAAPGLPTVVISQDLHAVWCNTAALERLGFDQALHSDGVLLEHDAFVATAAVSDVPDVTLDGFVADAVDEASERGLVGVVDLEMRFGLDRWARRVRGGTDGIRVRSGIYPDDLSEAVARGLRTGDVVEGTRGLVTVGPFKLVTDGSLGSRTAATRDTYPGTDSHGHLAYTLEAAIDLVRTAVDAGLVPAVHAIGDDANALALDIFEAVGVRGTIEHAQLLHDEDIPRFARLGVAASVQPQHAVDDREIADLLWRGRTSRAYPLRSLIESGATLLFGSDAPVAPLDPWATMAAAMTRTDDGQPPWHGEQRVNALTAWRATTGGAVSIGVGDVADLVLLERDPLAAAPDALRSMQVLGTAVAGRFTHRDV